MILHEDDLNAMYFSIENRSPFLDRELFEFSLHDPDPPPRPRRHGEGRAARVDARDRRPTAILDNRRKVGFNAPILDLLDTSDPEVREELLGDSPIWEHVRREPIEALLDARHAAQLEEQVPLQLRLREAVPGGVRAMRLDRQSSRRASSRSAGAADGCATSPTSGSSPTRCVTLRTESGTEVDVTRKSWGYYAHARR